MNNVFLLPRHASQHVVFFNSKLKSGKIDLRAYEEGGQIFFSRKKPIKSFRKEGISPLWNSVHSVVTQMSGNYYTGLLNFNKFVLRAVSI